MAVSPSKGSAGCPSADPSSGFTLVEILVAFAVASLLLGGMYQILSTGLRSASVAGEYSTALMLAESTMEEIGISEPIVVGDTLDRIPPSYARRLRVRPRPDLLPVGVEHPAMAPYEIEVTVSWGHRRRPRSVVISTVRLVKVP
jgi:general secretion pathway protein I